MGNYSLAIALVGQMWAAGLGILEPLQKAEVASVAPTTTHQSRQLSRRQPGSARSACPDTLEGLMPSLLRDLPSYANRVTVRSRNRDRSVDIPPSYILVAGREEYAPLPSFPAEASAEYQAIDPDNAPQQVFFTTLERRYGHAGLTRLQGFYWLFLTRSVNQWQVATVLHSVGGYPAQQPPSPPQEINDGVVAQAIRLWLRDCQAGSVQLDG